jgi:hypothetical protein
MAQFKALNEKTKQSKKTKKKSKFNFSDSDDLDFLKEDIQFDEKKVLYSNTEKQINSSPEKKEQKSENPLVNFTGEEKNFLAQSEKTEAILIEENEILDIEEILILVLWMMKN